MDMKRVNRKRKALKIKSEVLIDEDAKLYVMNGKVKIYLSFKLRQALLERDCDVNYKN
jgi:hypothetical protein